MVILSVLVIVLATLLVISVRYNLRHARIILNIEDALSEALDICDVAYNGISSILEPPVMLTTREGLVSIEGGIAADAHIVVKQMKAVRDSVLYVSNVLAAPFGGITEEEESADEG